MALYNAVIELRCKDKSIILTMQIFWRELLLIYTILMERNTIKHFKKAWNRLLNKDLCYLLSIWAYP